MVARCGAPPSPQSGIQTLGLTTDSYRTTWIGEEWGTPRKIWAATLMIHPPQGGTLGTILSAGSPCPHSALQWRGWTHTSSTPTTLPTYTSSSTTHSHTRIPARGVVPTGGRGAAGEAAPAHGPRGPRSVKFRSPCLCSGHESRGSGWGQCTSALPCPIRSDKEGSDTAPPAPPLLIQAGIGWGPPSNL